MTGIYIHIPFCAKKCPYCDFFSVPYQKQLTEQYVQAVIRNITAYQVSDKVDSIYLGGGTPSLLSASQINRILDTCAGHFCLCDPEITMEMNPAGQRAAYLKEIRSVGVNRLSIGTQSFSDEQLRLLGRSHSAADGIRCITDAVNAGFGNISCDLILAIPGHTAEVLDQSVSVLADLPVTHVSAYLLQIEEGTPYACNEELLRSLPDDDASADLYLHAVRSLAAAGFQQYEISSFAKSGCQSRHNLKYWLCKPYLGIGAAAHSCWNGRRFCVPKDVISFCSNERQQEVLIAENPCDREERLMLQLRLTEGVAVNEFSCPGRVQQLLKAGYIQCKDNRISLTPEGFAVSNSVISMLIS